MSRVSVLESLYSKKKSALEFNYDNLWAPPIRSLLSQEDINELIRIATSLKYNGKIDLKYKLIDKVMNQRGFRKAHAGTNRVVYNYLEDPRFVAKIAVDKVGMKDTPNEFKNQKYFAPFCCKIFEVDESGVIGFVERVNPITSLEEFLSVSDDVFNMIITKIVGKYVVDDIGTTKFMNFGLRMNGFGPVILDFPYAYELDGKKLRCNKVIDTPFGKEPCGGEIDYDDGFNYLVCTKCGRTYQARDLATESKDILILNDKGGRNIMSKARIIDAATGKVILDSSASTKNYVTKKQFDAYNSRPTEFKAREKVGSVRTAKRKSKDEIQNRYYTQLMIDKFNQQARAQEVTLGEILQPTKVAVGKTITNGKVKEYNKTKTKENIHKEEIKTEIPKVEVDNATECTNDKTEVIVDHKIEDSIDTIISNALGNLVGDEDSSSSEQIEMDLNMDHDAPLDLSNFTIGCEVEEEEKDYSQYVPEEDGEEEEEDSNEENELDYNEYIKDIKNNQEHKHLKFDKDMEEY